MSKTFWVHSEVEFTSDVQHFHSHLSDIEREVVKRSLLGIAQVEVAVKTFWGDLYKHLPKPEFNGLGATFAECEHRHAMAYSRLLEVLGYNDEFENLIEIPVFRHKLALIDEHFTTVKSFVEAIAFLCHRHRKLFALLSVRQYPLVHAFPRLYEEYVEHHCVDLHR